MKIIKNSFIINDEVEGKQLLINNNNNNKMPLRVGLRDFIVVRVVRIKKKGEISGASFFFFFGF
jgi:hypothetical protein